MPIFFSCLPMEKPGKSRSTMKAEESFVAAAALIRHLIGHGKDDEHIWQSLHWW